MIAASASDAVESYAAPSEVEEEAASDVAGGYLAPEEDLDEAGEEIRF